MYTSLLRSVQVLVAINITSLRQNYNLGSGSISTQKFRQEKKFIKLQIETRWYNSHCHHLSNIILQRNNSENTHSFPYSNLLHNQTHHLQQDFCNSCDYY